MLTDIVRRSADRLRVMNAISKRPRQAGYPMSAARSSLIAPARQSQRAWPVALLG